MIFPKQKILQIPGVFLRIQRIDLTDSAENATNSRKASRDVFEI